jgi:S-adenosylmethionine:tRNA ribosyltransferase-isomerase
VAEKGETDLRLVFNLTGDDFDAALAEAGACRCPPISPPNAPPMRRMRPITRRLCPPRGPWPPPPPRCISTRRCCGAWREKGVTFTEVTLHVGAGTFLPVKVEDVTTHRMHAEWGEVTAQAAAEINATTRAGGRIIPWAPPRCA